jgi:hypothetical protein
LTKRPEAIRSAISLARAGAIASFAGERSTKGTVVADAAPLLIVTAYESREFRPSLGEGTFGVLPGVALHPMQTRRWSYGHRRLDTFVKQVFPRRCVSKRGEIGVSNTLDAVCRFPPLSEGR